MEMMKAPPVQQPERTYTYLDAPHLGGTPNAFDNDLCVSFSFGISGKVSTLPDRATSRGTHFRDIRQISEDEANELLAARIRGKAAAAVRQGPGRAQLLLVRLSGWGREHLSPIVAAAHAEALAALTAAIAPPPASPPVDPVTALKLEIAGLTARLAALEGAKL